MLIHIKQQPKSSNQPNIKRSLFFVDILNTKNITDKQASYIINKVIIPTLEYQIQNIVIPLIIYQKILSKYLIIVKHKASHSKIFSNSTILNYNIYSIKNI